MNINDLTIGQAKELASLFGGNNTVRATGKPHAFEVGKSYFIRSVTHHYIGTVLEINELCIVMDHCVWVADDGRFHELMKGKWDDSSEREPYPPEKCVMIFYGGILDAVEWTEQIPASEK